MTNWDQPQEISKVVQAFPARVVGTLLPPINEIPKEFFGTNKWTRFASSVFFRGWDGVNPTLIKKPGVDAELAFAHFQTVLKSFEPKHEHKEAGAAYLLSLWFKDVVDPEQGDNQ